jgi:RNA polymerase sigma-70 factor (ECF subfamily)
VIASVESNANAPAVDLLSFEQVYADSFEFVYRNARRLGVPESAADDVVQEVFLVLHRRLAEYDGRATLRAWVYGILANTVRDYRRSFRRKQSQLVAAESDDDLGPASSRHGPEQHAERRRDMRLLLALLEELSEEQREVIVLAELEQLSIPEICACIGGNPNTVYSRLRVARETLKAKLTRRLLSAQRKERA